MDVPAGYVSAGKARAILGVGDNTLRAWAESGRIPCVRNGGKQSHRYYNVKEYLRQQGTVEEKEEIKRTERKKIIYCRVSTRNQLDDLNRQCEWMQSRYPDYTLIKDVGSGINFKRKGLKTILEWAIKGLVDTVVVAYKDRLCRFGFDLVKWIIEEFSGGKIVVLKSIENSPQAELVNDVISIINVFSARINGLRKYKQQITDEFKSDDTTEISFEE